MYVLVGNEIFPVHLDAGAPVARTGLETAIKTCETEPLIASRGNEREDRDDSRPKQGE